MRGYISLGEMNSRKETSRTLHTKEVPACGESLCIVRSTGAIGDDVLSTESIVSKAPCSGSHARKSEELACSGQRGARG